MVLSLFHSVQPCRTQISLASLIHLFPMVSYEIIQAQITRVSLADNILLPQKYIGNVIFL